VLCIKWQIYILHLHHLSNFSHHPVWFYAIPVCCTWVTLNTNINIIITLHTLRASDAIHGDCFMHYNNKQLRSLETAVGIITFCITTQLWPSSNQNTHEENWIEKFMSHTQHINENYIYLQINIMHNQEPAYCYKPQHSIWITTNSINKLLLWDLRFQGSAY
jgi:hypothetical protein